MEQGDELDRLSCELELLKQIKQHCLVGDTAKVELVCQQFHEQAEQLIELCRMVNQVAPTNKIKITTKSLAIWFELNLGHLLATCRCFSQNPHSRVAKDFAWVYIQGE